MTRAHSEYLIASGIVLVLIILLGTAGLRARAEVRDDLRRADITNLKHAVEMYYNDHAFYPTPPGSPEVQLGTPPLCTSSDQIDSWLFGNDSPLLEEGHINAMPHDVREMQGRVYTYCATKVQASQTQGFFFQARLEVNQRDQISFDEDEARKFTYRVLHENSQVLYRVCGGTETQCDPEKL